MQDAQGRRLGPEVLNKSAIVLITAIREACCEDLEAEALHTAGLNYLAMWCLADAGWKTLTKALLATLMTDRNRRLNTAKADQQRMLEKYRRRPSYRVFPRVPVRQWVLMTCPSETGR